MRACYVDVVSVSYVCMRVCISMYVRVHVYTYVCMYVSYVCICIACARAHAHPYMYMQRVVYACMCTRTNSAQRLTVSKCDWPRPWWCLTQWVQHRGTFSMTSRTASALSSRKNTREAEAIFWQRKWFDESTSARVSGSVSTTLNTTLSSRWG